MQFDTDQVTQDEITSEGINQIVSEEKQYFINDDKYQLLQQCQHAISKATDISPSIRKLVNELITIENVEKVKNKLIEFLSN